MIPSTWCICQCVLYHVCIIENADYALYHSDIFKLRHFHSSAWNSDKFRWNIFMLFPVPLSQYVITSCDYVVESRAIFSVFRVTISTSCSKLIIKCIHDAWRWSKIFASIFQLVSTFVHQSRLRIECQKSRSTSIAGLDASCDRNRYKYSRWIYLLSLRLRDFVTLRRFRND